MRKFWICVEIFESELERYIMYEEKDGPPNIDSGNTLLDLVDKFKKEIENGNELARVNFRPPFDALISPRGKIASRRLRSLTKEEIQEFLEAFK